MSDLISRRAAIDALHKKRIKIMEKGQDVNPIWECLDVIAQLPSVQLEPPEDICGECDAWNKYKSERKGKWINDNCSVCGQYVYHGDVRNYCPRCGAKMEANKSGLALVEI